MTEIIFWVNFFYEEIMSAYDFTSIFENGGN
jgi:hypothetical protein